MKKEPFLTVTEPVTQVTLLNIYIPTQAKPDFRFATDQDEFNQSTQLQRPARLTKNMSHRHISNIDKDACQTARIYDCIVLQKNAEVYKYLQITSLGPKRVRSHDNVHQ